MAPSSSSTVRIGVGVPLSGKAATLGREMANAVSLAVEDINRDGHGSPIEALVLDDCGAEQAGCETARAFINDARVLGLVGHYNSNVSLAAGPLYAEAGLAVIAPIVSNPRLTESGWRNVFRFTNRDDATADAIANHLALGHGKRRAAVIATRTVYGGSMAGEFARAFERRGGSVIRHLSVDEGETDFRPLLRELPHETDLVFYGGTFEGAPLVKAMRANGMSQLLATGDGCWDIGNFLEPAGKAAESGEGVLVLSACPELGTVPGAAAFAARYAEHFGPVRNYAVNAYDAAMTLLAAIRAARLDRAGVVQALRQCRRQGIAYAGATGWDAKGDNRAAVTALHTVVDGRFKQVAVVPRADNTAETIRQTG